jgi:hypothetical protein
MKVVSYIILAIAVFLTGLGLFFFIDEKSKAKKFVNDNLKKARAAKAKIAREALKPDPEIDPDITELNNLIENNDASKKEKEEAD